MKKVNLFLIIFSFAAFSCKTSQKARAIKNADDILHNFFLANGGKKNLSKNLNNHYTSSSLIDLETRKDTIKLNTSSCGLKLKKRTFIKYQGMQLGAVEIFDGKKGYNFFVSEEVFSTKKAINIENWDDKKIFLHVNNVDFTNPCRNYKEKGHKADYQGVTDFEGKECHKVKFIANPVYSDTAKLSKEEYYFFEKDTFVYYGMKTIEKNNDVIIEVNEKQNIINQVYVPQKILLKRNGNLTTILIYEKFLLNHKCDDEDFNFLNYQKE